MGKKEKIEFPGGFFTQKRPEISTKEALKDIVTIKWVDEVMKGNKKAVAYSAKTKKKF